MRSKYNRDLYKIDQHFYKRGIHLVVLTGSYSALPTRIKGLDLEALGISDPTRGPRDDGSGREMESVANASWP